MWIDEIVEETRRIREEHAAKFNFDLKAIWADLKNQERLGGHEVVSLPARKPLEIQGMDRDKVEQVSQDLADILSSTLAISHPAKDKYTFEQDDLSVSSAALTYEVRKSGELVYCLEPPNSQGEKKPYCVPGDWMDKLHRIADGARSARR
jgi:hypothetical protein